MNKPFKFKLPPKNKEEKNLKKTFQREGNLDYQENHEIMKRNNRLIINDRIMLLRMRKTQ